MDSSTIPSHTLTLTVFFPSDRVKCQDRLLIPDWIWLQSADAAACDTPEKACGSALNALVLTAESQAGGRALGHGDLRLAVAVTNTDSTAQCANWEWEWKGPLGNLERTKTTRAEKRQMTAQYCKHISCLTSCPFLVLVILLQLVRLAWLLGCPKGNCFYMKQLQDGDSSREHVRWDRRIAF